jgi:PASTA domain
VGLFRRMGGATVRILGCGALVAAAAGAGRAEAQAEPPDLRGCPGALATRFLERQGVPFDVEGDERLVVVGQDGDAKRVLLVFRDVRPSPDCSVVSVPGVVGFELNVAVDDIVGAGLRPDAEGTGTVAEQDPPEDSIVERGTTVSLVLGPGEPAGAEPGGGGLAGEAAGTGPVEEERPAGEDPAAEDDASAGDEPGGDDGASAGDEPAGEDQPAGADPTTEGDPGGDGRSLPASDSEWRRTVALVGVAGGIAGVALALLSRARPGRRRRRSVSGVTDAPRPPYLPARVRLVPHDVAQVVTAPDGGPLASVTASLDTADLVVRLEQGVSS